MTNKLLINSTYQLATPPFVIHIFVPLMIHSFPFFSAFVLRPATSDPAPGSVTQYACNFYTVSVMNCYKLINLIILQQQVVLR